jgi:hypothetical protein
MATFHRDDNRRWFELNTKKCAPTKRNEVAALAQTSGMAVMWMVVREVQVVSRNADGDGGKGEVSIIQEAYIIIPGGK